MKLPLRSLLTSGRVFLAEHPFPDGTKKRKFFVVLGFDRAAEIVYTFITTSQLQFFKDNPKLESEIVRVEPGTIAAFNKETAVDCRNAYPFQLKSLEALHSRGGLTPKGRLPAKAMRRVFETIRSSRLLSHEMKRTLAGFESQLES